MITESLLKKYKQLKESNDRNSFPVRHVRDLLVTELTNDLWMVVSSDSDGGIGSKKFDTIFSPSYDLGRLGTRVPLMEMLASGALPIMVVDVLSVEMEPTGKEIIRGVRDEVEEAGLNGDNVVTGSTEDNVETVQTGMGVVIIGIVDKSDFRPGRSINNDIVVSVGKLKSAPEYKVVFDDLEIANTKTVRQLIKLPFIHDILPVGSKGIKHEFYELAKSAGLLPRYHNIIEIDITKSGGPSTCCLVSLPENELENLKNIIAKPISLIGDLRG
ncbi:MAG: AIR synthase related protein [Melioribacteraceae bacterium]|nr:AIR synthase related protein [Melioribacteraceae bacterium]